MDRRKLTKTLGLFSATFVAILLCVFHASSVHAAITDDINTKARLNAVRQCYRDTSQGIVTPIAQSKIANGRIIESIARNGDKIVLTAGANYGTSESCRTTFNRIRGSKAISDITKMGYDGVGNGQDSSEGCYHYSFKYTGSDNSTTTGRSNKICCSLSGSGNNKTIVANSCQARTENTSSVRINLSLSADSIIVTNPNPKPAFTDNHGTQHAAEPREISNIAMTFNSGNMRWTDFVSRLDSQRQALAGNSRTFTDVNSSSNIVESEDVYNEYAANTRSVYDSSLRALRALTGNNTATFPRFTEKEAHDLLRYYFDREFDGTHATLGKGTCKQELDPAWQYAARLDGQWCEINGVNDVEGTYHIVDMSTYSNLVAASFGDIVKALMQIDYDDESFEDEEPGDINNDNVNSGESGNSSDDNSTKACFENASALGWIFCPIAQALGKALDTLYENVVESFLEVQASEMYNANGEIHNGWKTFRDFANIAFAIALLIVILSQVTGFGISNYGIKKILPTLIMIVVLVNISFFLCQIAIDVSNILGVALKEFFEGLSQESLDSFQNTGRSFVGGLLSAVGIVGISGVGITVGIANAPFIAGAVLANLPAVIITLVVMLISLFFFFLLLGVRQAGILIAVILSPLAVICYALPNTKSLFQKWKKLFTSLLMVYPICGLMMGATGFVSNLMLESQNSGFFFNLVAALLQVVPFFMIPSIVRSSMNVLGNLGTRIPQIGQRLSGFAGRQIRNSERLQDFQKHAEGDFAKTRYDRLMHKANGDLSNLSVGERRRLARYGARYRKQRIEETDARLNGANASEEIITNEIADMERKSTDKNVNSFISSVLNGRVDGIDGNDINSVRTAYADALAQSRARPNDERLRNRAYGLQQMLQQRFGDKGKEALYDVLDNQIHNNEGSNISDSTRSMLARLSDDGKWMSDVKATDPHLFNMINDGSKRGGTVKTTQDYMKDTINSMTPERLSKAGDSWRAQAQNMLTNNQFDAAEVDKLANAYSSAISNPELAKHMKTDDINLGNLFRAQQYDNDLAKFTDQAVNQYMQSNNITSPSGVPNSVINKAFNDFRAQNGTFQALSRAERKALAPPKGYDVDGKWIGNGPETKDDKMARRIYMEEKTRLDIHHGRR